jgi:hypothetical protein
VREKSKGKNGVAGAELEALLALGRKLDRRTKKGSYRIVLAESLLTVRTKKGRLMKLVANRAQREFEATCGRRNIELKAHMRWIVGNGNEGKIQELEMRIQKHETALQRTAGLGVAAGILVTLMHLALDSLKVMHR